MTNLKTKLEHPVFHQIAEVAAQTGIKTYVIGGFVRDLLLGIECKDLDFVVLGSGIEFAEKVGEHLRCRRDLVVYRNFGTAMLRYKGIELEFVGARKESYDRGSRKPIVENGTIEDDQKRRDFTINAMSISMNPENYGELIDPFGGLEHLKQGIIKTPLNPEITFSDDPLRIFRAARFACRLGFKIDHGTEEAMYLNRDRISILSKERIFDEITKIMKCNKPSIGWNILARTGVLEKFLPQLDRLRGYEKINGVHHKDNFIHTMQVLDNVAAQSDNIWLRWAALLHDIGKPVVKKFEGNQWTFHHHDIEGGKLIPGIFKSLKMPLGVEMKYVQKLVQMHHRPQPISNFEISDSAIRRLMYDGGAELDDLMILCEADITSKIEGRREQFLKNYKEVRRKMKDLEARDFVRCWQPPIDGEIIMKTFNVKPSKVVGIIKDTIKESILDGIIENTYEAAYALMLKLGAQNGLVPTSNA